LEKRLDNLQRLDPSHAEIMEAAKVIRDFGNGGAHGEDVDRDKLLAAYELLEIELRRLFNYDASRRQVLIENLRT